MPSPISQPALRDPASVSNGADADHRGIRALVAEWLSGPPAGGVLLLVGLDQFADLVAAHGAATADAAMHMLGDVLRVGLPNDATLVRFDSSEHGIFLPHADGERGLEVARRLCDAVSATPFTTGGQPVPLSASVGVSVPPVGVDGARLPADVAVDAAITRAHVALRAARQAGNCARRDDAEPAATPTPPALPTPPAALRPATAQTAPAPPSDDPPRGMVVRERVATALDNGDMVLYAQPIIDLRNDQVTAYELLLRLRDGRTPHLEPRSFLAPAEHTDLAARIDRWVVGQAIAVLASPHARRRGVRLHVNLTGRTLADPAFGDDLLRDLRRAGVDPFRLGLEVGEAAAVHDADRVRRLVDRLADASCPVVLDDFGSGLGALQSLQRVPYAAVKVAGPLIDHADRSDRDRAVVEGIVRLARGLRLQVIAEEIDRPALLEAVRDAGVRGAQGFLLGAPHPLAQVLPRLR